MAARKRLDALRCALLSRGRRCAAEVEALQRLQVPDAHVQACLCAGCLVVVVE